LFFNVSLKSEVETVLAKKLLNLDMKGATYFNQWSKSFNEYFRTDLIYSIRVSKSDEELRLEKLKELREFISFCDNALKTVFVKKWLAECLLEIKCV
jgi:hypothetical protein